MFTSTLTAAPAPVSATVTLQGHALILFLPQADSQAVWRFDLDGLTDHAFRLTGRDGYYDLSIIDTTGLDIVLTRFLDKQDAQHILQLIHQALRNSTDSVDNTIVSKTRKPSALRRLLAKLTFLRALIIIVIAVLLWLLLSPTPFRVWSTMSTSTPISPALPGGVPLDADSILPK